MAKIESYSPGNLCWAELATSDQADAQRFYSQLLNWTTEDLPLPAGTYTVFQTDGNSAAAVYAKNAAEPTHWKAYFSVTSVDETVDKINAAGGNVLFGPLDLNDAGRMAQAADPQGATFCLWQANKTKGATHPGPLHQVTWPELATPDPASAVAFYSAVFDWKTHPATGFETAHYLEWVNDGKHIGGLMPMRGEQWSGIPPHWMLYITVENCDASATTVKELGGKLVVPPTHIPNVGRFCMITDPQGAYISLVQMAAAPPV